MIRGIAFQAMSARGILPLDFRLEAGSTHCLESSASEER